MIFDLDGTLVVTEEFKAISHARSVAELRPDVREEAVISAYADDLVCHSRQEVAVREIEAGEAYDFDVVPNG